MSLIPGAAVATTSRAPDDTSRFEIRRQAVVLEVLEQGLVGGERAGPDLALAAGPAAGGSTTSS